MRSAKTLNFPAILGRNVLGTVLLDGLDDLDLPLQQPVDQFSQRHTLVSRPFGQVPLHVHIQVNGQSQLGVGLEELENRIQTSFVLLINAHFGFGRTPG